LSAALARHPSSNDRRSIARAWVTAGLFAGVCDLTGACLHAGWFGAAPMRVFHAVASGLLGREAAISGGVPTALLGILLHFVIAFGAAGTYLAVSRVWSFLAEKPFIAGPIYGVIVYWFMQLVVIPLSQIVPRPQPISNRVVAICIHIVCVGLPIAWSVSRFAPRRERAQTVATANA
jgi:hypothetical protein